MEWLIRELGIENADGQRREFESQRERLIGLMQGFLRDARNGESAKSMTTALIAIAAVAKECFRLEEELFSQSHDSNKSRERQKTATHHALHQSVLADINLALKQVAHHAAATDMDGESAHHGIVHCIDALIVHLARADHAPLNGARSPATWPAKH